jgi:hypothetical protein
MARKRLMGNAANYFDVSIYSAAIPECHVICTILPSHIYNI